MGNRDGGSKGEKGKVKKRNSESQVLFYSKMNQNDRCNNNSFILNVLCRPLRRTNREKYWKFLQSKI